MTCSSKAAGSSTSTDGSACNIHYRIETYLWVSETTTPHAPPNNKNKQNNSCGFFPTFQSVALFGREERPCRSTILLSPSVFHLGAYQISRFLTSRALYSMKVQRLADHGNAPVARHPSPTLPKALYYSSLSITYRPLSKSYMA